MMFPVMPDVLDVVWKQAQPLLDASIRKGDEVTPADVYRRLVAGHSQLWVVVDGPRVLAAAVTELNVTPRRKLCRVWLVGGKADWLACMNVLKEWAASEDCAAISICGRRGWMKTLPDWKLTSVELECAL